MRRRRSVAVLLAALLVLAAGCSSYQAANKRLERWDPNYGYRPFNVAKRRPMGDVVLMLAFSGGGTRAAALAYGVLQELRDTRISVGGKEERLLDEVDLISSVSGGSFTSAYYALFGERIFEDFEPRFLRRNIQSKLILTLFSPISWFRMAFSGLNRSELAIRIYDKEIFDHKTFGDLDAAGGPLIQINAADLIAGTHFTFFQPQFDLICSDLSSLEVARAVAASSAVPGAFNAMTLRSYAGTCGFERPIWLDQALHERKGSMRRVRYAQTVDTYLTSKRNYIFLVDGGVADNLGLRGPLDNVILVGGIRQRLEQIGGRRPSRLVTIVVNAEVHPEPAYAYSFAGPGIAAMLNAVSGVQIYSYNFETMELMRSSLRDWARDLTRDGEGREVRTYMPEVAFENIEDDEQRAYFNALPTSFTLSDEQVDQLIAAGRRLLRESPDFQRLLADLSPQPPSAVRPGPDELRRVDPSILQE